MENTNTKRAKISNQPDSAANAANTFTDDTAHLLNIIPKEVWNIVLINVDNGTDYYKICRACSLFQNLLKSHRTIALISDVLNIMADRFENTNPRSDVNEVVGNDAAIINCAPLRLVNRAWKKTVDCILVDKKPYLCLRSFLDVSFKTLSDITRFESHFESTHLSHNVNPFPGRKLEITVPEQHDQHKLFYKAVLSVLENYGKHVWHFQINSSPYADPSTNVRVFNHFKVMLGLLPNLSVLKTNFDLRGLTDEQLQKLVAACKHAPFLTPPKLAVIKQYTWPFPLFKELIKPVLSNLNTVRTEFVKAQDFQEFCGLGLRLTDLKICASSLPVSCETILSAVETSFGETLTDLFIWFPERMPVKVEGRPKFPKLTSFMMRMDLAVPLDFLLESASQLAMLGIIIDSFRRLTFQRVKKRERVIQFYTHLNNLQDSNIWTEFPKLQRVEIIPWSHDDEIKACIREQWQARQDRSGE